MNEYLKTFIIKVNLLAMVAIWVSMNNKHGSHPQNLPPL
jgi:hypothetical protein